MYIYIYIKGKRKLGIENSKFEEIKKEEIN